MKLSEETTKEILMNLLTKNETKESPWKVGDKWFFRTVTYHLTGRIKAINGQFLKLEDSAWIADSGRFADAIRTGKLDEVEPVFVDVVINTESLVDAFAWPHELPREQK